MSNDAGASFWEKRCPYNKAGKRENYYLCKMKKLALIALVALAAVSCRMAGRFRDAGQELFRGEVVARAGDHKLHRSQLESYIPAGVSPEDSARLASGYITAWAEDLLMMDMAEKQLSKKERDVTEELEEYRRNLLKYRYEQLYINQRLDTLVTDREIEQYYKDNPQKFRLDRPVVRARYMIIPANAKGLKVLRRRMASEEDDEVTEMEQITATAAIKYADQSDTWMDIISLAQELGTDYNTLLGAINNQWVELPDDSGNLRIAYITEMVREGKTAPLEYCRGRIRDLVLSARKHDLQNQLEQSLLEDARKNNKFVIY